MFFSLLRSYGKLRHKLRPSQILVLGYFFYTVIGVAVLSLPICRTTTVRLIDNLFNVVSAISTTGLSTVSVPDSYTFWGQLTILILVQLGGIGYMTVSSFIIIARGKPLSQNRIDVLNTGFALPKGFHIKRFIWHLMIFSLIIEAIGSTILWIEFKNAGIENPFWFAVFHCISAFATAGFGLLNNNLEPFRNNFTVNITLDILCFLGSIGFIVLQDVWLAFRFKRKTTFTSQIIVSLTLLVFAIGTPLIYFFEPTVQNLMPLDRMLASSFQVISASTTAGFNSIPIAGLSAATIMVLIIAMLIGASPSGTGGGIKTTSVSSLFAIVASMVRSREKISFFNREIPESRLFTAVAHTTIYISVLFTGILLLCLTNPFTFEQIFFEASSALGTVGLSMGITSSFNDFGKIILSVLMYVGRVGVLTVGLSLFAEADQRKMKVSDLAV